MQGQHQRAGTAVATPRQTNGRPDALRPGAAVSGVPRRAGAFRLARMLIGVALLTALTALVPATANAEDPVARVIELTNIERQKHGLGPVQPNPQLAQAAQQYAQVLASSGCFAHTCGPVPDFRQRVAQAGYTGWTALHENLAAGQRTPEEAVAVWMASPPHRDGLLCATCNEIGVGVAQGGPYGIYWVQELAARPTSQYQVVLGFKALADQIPSIVGSPIENERHNPVNGDGLQLTTRGLMVWRKSDNRTAFTNGRYTWIIGPYGLQSRPNNQRFAWER